MKLELYNNESGFRPSGKVLDYWKFLPQTEIDKDAPSLFGNIKSMFLPNVMVIILIFCEVGLFYTMQEQGVSFMTLLALSIFDFVVGILPAIILIYGNLIKGVINTNIFITETRINLNGETPHKYSGNRAKYLDDLQNELAAYKKQNTIRLVIEVVMAFAIIALASWKFYSLYEVFGSDIFVLGIGRYVIVVILLSIITHIFFTKIVFANLVFRMLFNSQKSAFGRNKNKYSVKTQDMHKSKEVTFFGKFKYAYDGKQFVAKELEKNDAEKETEKSKLIDIKVGSSSDDDDNETRYYSKRKSDSNEGVSIVYTGILNDPEISVLVTEQTEDGAKAILSTAKQIQLSYN